MNALLDLRLLGWLLLGLAALEFVPAIAALAWGESPLPYAASAIVTAVWGLPFALASRTDDARIRPRDAFLLVGMSWLLASAFGALPYVTTGVLSPVDALFESVAGFTTTASSVFSDVESVPKPLLIWRATTQWVGGLGVLVFTVAVVPLLGIGGMHLFNADVPRAAAQRFTPRAIDTVRRLGLLYGALTLAAFIGLLAAGLGFFDALCHALTSVSTGGFSTRNGSVGAFESPAVEWVVVMFMIVGGMNFVLLYRLAARRVGDVLRDAELRYFALVLLVATVVIAAAGWGADGAGEVGLRQAVFQSVSLATGTGYHTADWELWPNLAQFVLLLLMVLGGMSGSTSGGLRTLRSLLGLQALRATLARLLHPRGVRPVKYGVRTVSEDELSAVWACIIACFLIAAAVAGVIAFAGADVVTALSAALSAIGNVGPALGEAGPTDDFGHFPGYAKLALCISMIVGRLEIFTVLVLLSPRFWRP